MKKHDQLAAELTELILNSSKDIDEIFEQFCMENKGETPHRLLDVWQDVLESMPELN